MSSGLLVGTRPERGGSTDGARPRALSDHAVLASGQDGATKNGECCLKRIQYRTNCDQAALR
jgi:hypothetical protein